MMALINKKKNLTVHAYLSGVKSAHSRQGFCVSLDNNEKNNVFMVRFDKRVIWIAILVTKRAVVCYLE